VLNPAKCNALKDERRECKNLSAHYAERFFYIHVAIINQNNVAINLSILIGNAPIGERRSG
jgi:hypothetical protein